MSFSPTIESRQIVSRRKFLTTSAMAAGTAAVAGQALADTLADVPPRGPGATLSSHSERSEYVKIDRIPEAGPGMRNVSPDNAINSKTPLGKLVGTITPSDLHYERSHAGVPDIDPAAHRLLIHGMTRKSLVLTLDDLKAMPTISRIHFIECTGNGWENWKKADETLTVQNTHGLVSTNEWTGVPLKFIIDLVGKDRDSNWMLAEGGDGAGVDRSIPMTEEIVSEAFIAYGQNGEPLRPAHGFPMRHAGHGGQSAHQMAAPPQIRRPALDDPVGDRALHPTAGRRQGAAVSTPHGDQFCHHLTVRHDGDQARL